MRRKAWYLVAFMGLFLGLFYFFARADEGNARIVFIADTHASVDSKDRSDVWGKNTFTRLQEVFSEKGVHPTHLVWVGDLMDFLPSEWNIVRNWVKWVSSTHSDVAQYAVMGNHEYIYYDYPEIQGVFNNPLRDGYRRDEVESFLAASAQPGDIQIMVKSAANFVVGSQVLLLETPPRDTSEHFYIGLVRHVDKVRGTLELAEPVPTMFLSDTTAVRQGFTEKRGIVSFLATFEGTETTSTKSVFTIGNTCFVLISMDRFFDFDDHSKRTKALSEDDFHWLEAQLAKHQPTHNIVVVSHEMPNSGSALGGLFDPTDTVDYNDETRARLMALATKYEVSAWISGHTHPDARKDVVHSLVGKTNFLLVPSFGMGAEGQALVLTPRDGSNSLDFEFWSTDQKSNFGKISVPTRLRVNGG